LFWKAQPLHVGVFLFGAGNNLTLQVIQAAKRVKVPWRL
jgi:hypothetical protein